MPRNKSLAFSRQSSDKYKGFTLIELLVVIAIIAVLSTIGFAAFRGFKGVGNDAKRNEDIIAISKAYEGKFNGQYSPLVDTDFVSGKKPQDPTKGDYYNWLSSDGSWFKVCASLEANPNNSCNTPAANCICKFSAQGSFTSSTIADSSSTNIGIGTGGSSPAPACDPNGILSSGLRGYWKMDESSWNGTSGEVKDYMGVNNGTASGTNTTLGQTGFGNAGSFNGNGHVALANQPNLTNGFTFSAWVKRTADTRANVFNNNQFILRVAPENENSSNPFEAFVKLSNGSVESRVGSGVASTVGTWFNVVVTWDKATLKIYVNGLLKNSAARNGLLTGTTVQARIGRGEQTNTTINPWTGLIDDVRFYDHSLSESEISTLYNNGQGCISPS